MCAYTGVGQLLKLPTLIHHYLEHHDDENEEEHDLSFLDFLKIHYFEDNHADNAEHDHNNLPFKTLDCPSVNIVFVSAQPHIFVLYTASILSSKNVAVYALKHYSSTSFGNIWQPPKLG